MLILSTSQIIFCTCMVRQLEYFGITRSITLLLMHYNYNSICNIDGSLPFTRNDFNYMRCLRNHRKYNFTCAIPEIIENTIFYVFKIYTAQEGWHILSVMASSEIEELRGRVSYLTHWGLENIPTVCTNFLDQCLFIVNTVTRKQIEWYDFRAQTGLLKNCSFL